MNYKNHFVELWVNGEKVELESQDSLNMRFNSVLFDPTKIESKQGEYSFEFEVPATPKNNIIFNYANNSAAENKFSKRYSAYVYADGDEIFHGSLTVNSYEKGYYSLNLVQIKSYSMSELFDEMKMNEIKWEIPFDGVRTINTYNANPQNKVMFPLVSYGVFQKAPYGVDEDTKYYTSKFLIDGYNKWYIEDFYPSLNVMETMKKAFETKGFTVGGDALTDPLVGEVYMSCNLASGQVPQYNLGSPQMGKVNLGISWRSSGAGFQQDLKYPYYRVGGSLGWQDGNKPYYYNEHNYNLASVQIYDILEEGSVTIREQPAYMFDQGEHIIVAPASGYYKIHLDVNARLEQAASLTAQQWVGQNGSVVRDLNVNIPPNFLVTMPLEIQLVKNYDENVELIKGKENMEFWNGRMDGNYDNYHWYVSCFPHEKLGNQYANTGIPTKPDYLCSEGEYVDWSLPYGKLYNEMDCKTINATMHIIDCQSNHLMGYDPVVNPNFIMGFSSMGRVSEQGEDWSSAHGGVASVIKNGKSWSVLNGDYNQLFYTWGNPFQWNPAIQSGVRFSITQGTMSGGLDVLVHLEKNDILQLFGVHRDYVDANNNPLWYLTSANINLSVEAVSPENYETLSRNNTLVWDEETQQYISAMKARYGFSNYLQLGEFLNKETKISDWIDGVKNAFNLEIKQDENNIFIDRVKTIENAPSGVVDINEKVNIKDASFKKINYPSYMAIKYKVDADEWGFERSAVNAAGSEYILDDPNWKEWADSGYTKIVLNTDEYVTSKSEVNLSFSYTWYDNFSFNGGTNLRIPVISKYSYMIDGYDYDESMKHDGYGQAQRFWFTPQPTSLSIWTQSAPSEQIFLYIPQDVINLNPKQVALNYKAEKDTLLDELFNVNAYLSSNFVELDVYLNSDEYNRIRCGSYVGVDTDIYIPAEIEGYDPTGANPTTLKLMKKIN